MTYILLTLEAFNELAGIVVPEEGVSYVLDGLEPSYIEGIGEVQEFVCTKVTAETIPAPVPEEYRPGDPWPLDVDTDLVEGCALCGDLDEDTDTCSNCCLSVFDTCEDDCCN